LAPELSGASELVGELARSGVRVSLGHSRATSAEARAAARAGACGVTHLFNAMSGVHHREMGLAGFALTDAALFAEIIGDLVHVGPEAFELALRARAGRAVSRERRAARRGHRLRSLPLARPRAPARPWRGLVPAGQARRAAE